MTTAGKNLSQLTTFVADYQLYGQLTGFLDAPATLTLNGKAPFSVKQDADNFIEALHSLSFQTTTVGSANANRLVYALAFEARTIEGILHLKGEATAGSKGWVKISLPKAFTALSDNGLLAVGDLSKPNIGLLRGLIDPDLATSLTNLESIPGLVKITRQAGPFIDNQPTMQVTATFDMPTLFKYMLGDGMATTKDISTLLNRKFTDLDLNDAPTAAGIKQGSLIVTWYYGSKDQLYHGFSFNSSLKLQGKAAEIVTGKLKSGPVNARATVTIRLSQIGKPVTVQDIKPADVLGDLTDAFINVFKLK
jgi:hypothetical protein